MATVELAQAGKFLTFSLGSELYGLEILRVQEIVGMLPVTRVPRLPDYVAGVVNLRGRIIPVVDIRRIFAMKDLAWTERTCIVVVRVEREGAAGATVLGVIVDEVSDVLDLSAEKIEATPEFGIEVDTSFIKGVGRIEERVVLLLDIDRVLSGSELNVVELAAREDVADQTVEGEL
jgi:purine-binding chemotaxis protein CheW